MGKIIKKSIKYFIIVAGVIIMFPTMLYLLLQIPAVQTAIVKRITSHFSAELKSTISIGRIDYRFFNRLSLSDVLIKDKHNDTLLYSKNITAGVRRLDLNGKNIGLGRVAVMQPVVQLITDTTGLMNLTWYLDLLKKPADTTKTSKTEITISKIDLEDARFSLINHSDTSLKKKSRIDFSNLNLSGINGSVEDLHIYNDTTSFNVHNLSFNEKNGFAVRMFSSDVSLSGTKINLSSVFLHTDSSTLNLNKVNLAADSSFKDFLNKVKLNVVVEKSFVNSSDLAYFISLPADFNETVTLSGRFAGTISELRGRNVEITYRNKTSLDCDFDVSGLPKIENAFYYIGVNGFKTSAKDIENLKIPGKGKINLPPIAYRLGNISFAGSFTGFTTDFVTYGEFRTSQGNISTDISLRPEKSNSYKMKGLLSGININLGELADSKTLGKLSIQANVDGSASSLKKFAGDLKGKIDSIEINNYNYRNIALNGSFTEKTWDGSINVEDQNIKLDLLGMFNFSDTLPEFDFTLNLAEADLYKLNIDKADTTASLSMLLTSNFRGNSIDNLDGEIKLLNSNIVRKGKNLELYDFSVRTFTRNNKPALSLRTDFVNAELEGYYNFAGLKSLVSNSLSSIMPSLFPVKPETIKNNNFDFNVTFSNTDKLNQFFNTGLTIADNSYIRGSVTPDSVISIEGSSAALNFKNIIFSDLKLQANASGSSLKAGINTSSVLLPGNTDLKGFTINLNTAPDKFVFNVNWDNKTDIPEKGNITARGSIEESVRGAGKPVLRIEIDSTGIYTRNDLWKINRSAIRIDSNAIAVDRIHISSAGKFYDVYGGVSVNPADTLHLQFKGIDISPLNYLGKQAENTDTTTKIKLDIAGILDGKLSLTNVYKNLLLESDIAVNDFSILGSRYGTISIKSAYDYSRKVVDINAGNNLGGTKMFDVQGYYDPLLKKINLGATAIHLPVEALNPLLKVFASNIHGSTSGKVTLYGSPGNLMMKGAVLAENVNMKVNYLQTNYKLNDSVRFDTKGFRFSNVKFADEEGRFGSINGYVYHKNFRDYAADLTINMGTDMLVLNTKEKDNPMFYGKVYASGVTQIRTSPELMSFDISAKTGKNSKFYIPLTQKLSVTEHPFISFIDSAQIKQSNQKPKQAAPKQLGLEVNIDLTITADAEAEMIFDPTVGDKITGSGTGTLNINLNPKGDFTITGDYTIERGEYLFTMKNILNKRFQIENGGKIYFNGPLDNAEVDLLATYQKFNTSLYPVVPQQEFDKGTVSVEPQLLLTGRLFNPNVKFEINLPNADEQTKTYLQNAISTEEEMSRQFLFLLVMKRFYTDTQQSNPVETGTASMAVTTTEMLSNQLSNWISQISDNFNLGFQYRPGDRTLNSDELNVAFQTQIFDNNVTINGNLDYGSSIYGTKSTNNTDQITGDFDAEFRITDKVRFKVFNRFNDVTLYKGPYTQGIGILFKQDFKKFTDLFRRKEKPTMKKEEEVSVKEK